MRRREFVQIAATAAAWPSMAHAQKAMPVIGFLNAGDVGSFPKPFMAAFHKGLSNTGYIEGKNLAVEYRWAEGNFDRLPALAADLVGRKVDVIVSSGGQATRAAKNATSTIPIVFMGVGDPVGLGLVANLARPGGNVTGFSNITGALHPKRLELLSELVPQARVVAMLVNPNNPTTSLNMGDMQEAARRKGIQLPILNASTENEIDAAFSALVEEVRAGALLLSGDVFFATRRDQLLALASRHAVPAISMWRDFVEAGGLISYGINNISVFTEIGIYTSRILNGDKPADLPVQQPTKFELVINLKTAKALGLTVPQSLLARADEVIE